MKHTDYKIISSLRSFLSNNSFPCVAAKDAVAKDNMQIMVASHIGCPADDKAILDFIYTFTRAYRKADKGFYSAAIIFKEPVNIDETMFDCFMWQRLKALQDLDAKNFKHDTRVSANPALPEYGFSLMEEAFFILGLHSCNSRTARQFDFPTLVFNPHNQFVQMKKNGTYEKMKTIIRKRDMAFAGSINPMLTDFGEASEVYQYSGQVYNEKWECPLKINK